MKNHHIQPWGELLLIFGSDLPGHVSLQTFRDMVEVMVHIIFTLTYIDLTVDEKHTKKSRLMMWWVKSKRRCSARPQVYRETCLSALVELYRYW